MTFRLSSRSIERLEGVNPVLVDIVNLAITKTKVDFGVSCGVRTLDTQKKLVESGKSQTMRSYHLLQDDMTSWAVDLVAYIDGDVCWEVNVYDDVADAIQSACKEIDTKGFRVRWGGAWSVSDLANWNKSMEEAYLSYIDYKRKLKQRPFFDGPHFELNK